jgi:hypothetical protein
MYAQAIPLLLRHPSVLVAPLLAAVVQLLLGEIAPFFTDPLGGLGTGLFNIVAQLVYGFAFAVAIIAANDIWRKRNAGFDAAWDEARHNVGGILIATIGFYFLIYVAALVGSIFAGILGLVLQLVAAFFLIYTIPAAAIGGMPGQLAIGASLRAARDAVVPTIVLAIVFVFLFFFLPNYLLTLVGPYIGVIADKLAYAILQAIVLAYLAFPFAKQYDDIAFTRRW